MVLLKFFWLNLGVVFFFSLKVEWVGFFAGENRDSNSWCSQKESKDQIEGTRRNSQR
jgi:hypothetical protein